MAETTLSLKLIVTTRLTDFPKNELRVLARYSHDVSSAAVFDPPALISADVRALGVPKPVSTSCAVASPTVRCCNASSQSAVELLERAATKIPETWAAAPV